MAKKKAKTGKVAPLPKRVYVGINNPGNKLEEYLTASPDPEVCCNMENNPGDVMGEYELVRVVRFRKEETTFLDDVKFPPLK